MRNQVNEFVTDTQEEGRFPQLLSFTPFYDAPTLDDCVDYTWGEKTATDIDPLNAPLLFLCVYETWGNS